MREEGPLREWAADPERIAFSNNSVGAVFLLQADTAITNVREG